MSKKIVLKPIAAALGAAFVTSLAGASAASASENPFAMTELASGYMVVDAHMAEGKCGEGAAKTKTEGKCGEGKCGEGAAKAGMEGKCGEGKEMKEGKCGEGAAKTDKEGKCGEGKCGEGVKK